MEVRKDEERRKQVGTDFDTIFYPRSVAVVGASSDPKRERTGWIGRLLEFGYRGKLYPIHPQAQEILGLEAYPTMGDIPEPVDYAILAVRAELVPKVLEDCVAKQVKAVHIYTAGFGESATGQGKRLQGDLDRIDRGNTRVIGPNCMGVYCPASRMTFNIRFSKEEGSVGILSQSGAALMRLIPAANQRGIRFSKAVSFGNALDLNGSDFLEYLAEDPKTKVIFCYLEGVKDGRRFLEATRECTKTKPVIFLKGGMTGGGRRAAASHTASLGGSEQVWKAFFKQTRAIPVEIFEEAVEQLVALQNLGEIGGRGIGIVSRGGGPGVVTTDICERAGLSVPELSQEVRDELAKIIAVEAGSAITNPVEAGLSKSGVSQAYAEALKLVASDPGIHALITRIGIESYVQYGIRDREVEEVANVLIEASRTLPKPLAVVVDLGQTPEAIAPALRAGELLSRAGVAVFSSMPAAVMAITKVIRYREFD